MDSKLEVEQLHSRAEALLETFQQGGGESYIDEAIALDREVLKFCPPSHRKRPAALCWLATDLTARYAQLGTTHRDLDEATTLAREALVLCPQGHPDRSMSLRTLAMSLSNQYKQLGTMENLDAAIVLDREVLSLQPDGHPNRSDSLNDLALELFTRYQQLGVMQDLDEAIDLNREALSLRPDGHPDRCDSLGNLAKNLSTRYDQLGAMQDLDEAIVLDREALNLRPEGHPNRCDSLNSLAKGLSTRYEQFGTMHDLDEAIVLDREALSVLPEGNPNRSVALNNLASDLLSRYEQLQALQDLDEAIVLLQGALGLRPSGHHNRSNSLNSLAAVLHTRYEGFGVTQDLNDSIELSREALSLRPEGHPNRSDSLGTLANSLSTRYEQFGAMQDLDEAIALQREALSIEPDGYPNRHQSLIGLAANLALRYEHLGAVEDVDEAIVLDRGALDLCPHGHPDWSRCLKTLASYLHTRFTQSKSSPDMEELFSLYTQLAQITPFVSSTDIFSATEWAHTAETFQHPTLLLAYETTLQMIVQHLATLPSLPQHHVIPKELTSSLAVDAFSACLRHNAPARAVELLEQGRAMFWSQLSRFHSALDGVIEFGSVGKTLADEFAQLALDILNTINAPSTDQHESLWHLNLKLQDVVSNIRKLPGLSRFLLPPLFSDLQSAASGGPVIILNASEYSCDVLIVFMEIDPVHIPLRITREDARDLLTELHTLTVRAKRGDMAKELAYFLRKLWNQIVSPIADSLQTMVPFGSRVWWCPTAEFTALPLHAAGPFRKGQRNLPDLYISSYTSTLSSLIRARQSNSSSPPIRHKRFLAIGQATAVGESKLLSVGSELNTIGQLVDDRATFTHIEGEESCISRVVEELAKNEWVHLACHGLPNEQEPFESAFALHDGHFTIQRIIGCKLKNPEFAYLSACHTTVGDEESPDEVIHLASAMQFIGFRSVIGTMWAVDDGETNKITSTFYKYMVDESGRLDHTRAAYALNKTMRIVNTPFDQRILYIHLGA